MIAVLLIFAAVTGVVVAAFSLHPILGMVAISVVVWFACDFFRNWPPG
jgi:hypothetical protein